VQGRVEPGADVAHGDCRISVPASLETDFQLPIHPRRFIVPRAASRRLSIDPSFRSIARLIAVWAALLLFVGTVSAEEGYRLNPQDIVHVRVVDWHPADTSLQDWTPIGGNYTIDQAGNISFPFLGPMRSAGRTTADLAAAISAGLRQALALTNAPDVTVEIAQFSPVYVTGDVKSAGKYPFVPGLNVIQAVSLAGGEARAADYNTPTEHDLITAQGDYQVYADQLLRLQITRARLDAELASKSTFALPPDIAGQAKAQELAKVEQSVMTADMAQVTSQLDALKTQIATLTSELTVLQQKRQSTDQQIQVDQQELDNVKKLAGGGLTTNDRVASAARDLNDLQVQGLDIDTAVLQAQQAMGQAQQQSAQIVSKHTADLTLLRQQTDQQIVEFQLKLATQKQLIANAAAYVSQNGAVNGTPIFSFSYSILRGTQQLPATSSTPVEPGDVVMVKVEIAG
jgi:exopolysaccharide production protein ExoF